MIEQIKSCRRLEPIKIFLFSPWLQFELYKVWEFEASNGLIWIFSVRQFPVWASVFQNLVVPFADFSEYEPFDYFAFEIIWTNWMKYIHFKYDPFQATSWGYENIRCESFSKCGQVPPCIYSPIFFYCKLQKGFMRYPIAFTKNMNMSRKSGYICDGWQYLKLFFWTN